MKHLWNVQLEPGGKIIHYITTSKKTESVVQKINKYTKENRKSSFIYFVAYVGKAFE
ncbi:MAG: hypothetical protein AABY22_30470 [Nanoarchaeota archaeon]